MRPADSHQSAPPTLGLRANLGQFSLLVVVNAFVGGMVGLERTILPTLAQTDFAMASQSAILSFIVVFGITKAIANYYAGRWASRVGRKNVLVMGWLLALPIAPLLMWAPTWNWVVVANVLLGANQGLAWSSTVVMKIDLVGPKQRGLAMGLNEFAGYLAVGATAFATGWMAGTFGLRPYPFYLGVVLSVAGLLLSMFALRDTGDHVALEATRVNDDAPQRLSRPFWETTWARPSLGAVTQAGLVNNLNDGLVWGLFPAYLAASGRSLTEVALIVGLYPAVWGVGQLFTGRLADTFAHRGMLTVGMMVQGLALMAFMWVDSYPGMLLLAALLGLGTATVYPTFLVAIAAGTHPEDRAHAIGVFRMWRDLGYAVGALATGIIADGFGMEAAIGAVAALTFASGMVVRLRMPSPNSG